MSKRGDWGDKTIVVLHSKDERRHRKWCEHYRKEDGLCYKTFAKCAGSAHCNNYKLSRSVHIDQSLPIPKPPEAPPDPKGKQPFAGIQMIAMSDIIMPTHKLNPPALKRVAELHKYYQEHGTLDKPIIVSCAGQKYRLEDRYLRYYVAKELGLKEIPAKIGKREETKTEDAIRKKGAVLIHKTYGRVVVESSTLKHSVVVDDDGKQITLDIETCVNKKLFSVVD